MLYSLVTFPKVSHDILTLYCKTFNNSPCFTKFFAHTSIQSSLHSDLIAPFLALIFSPYLLSFELFIPFLSTTNTFPHIPMALAKLDYLIFYERASLVLLSGDRQTVSSSTGYPITLMVPNLSPMNFSFHCIHLSGVLQLP